MSSHPYKGFFSKQAYLADKRMRKNQEKEAKREDRKDRDRTKKYETANPLDILFITSIPLFGAYQQYLKCQIDYPSYGFSYDFTEVKDEESLVTKLEQRGKTIDAFILEAGKDCAPAKDSISWIRTASQAPIYIAFEDQKYVKDVDDKNFSKHSLGNLEEMSNYLLFLRKKLTGERYSSSSSSESSSSSSEDE